jgi:hypothetical protein
MKLCIKSPLSLNVTKGAHVSRQPVQMKQEEEEKVESPDTKAKSLFFLCDTPDGADWTTCPVCEGYSEKTTVPFFFNLKDYFDESKVGAVISDCRQQYDMTDDEDVGDYDDNGDLIFCIRCKVPFQLGNTFIERGCTSSTYHAKMIKQFTLNGETHTGIPTFKSYKQFKKLVKNKRISFKWGTYQYKRDATYISVPIKPI